MPKVALYCLAPDFTLQDFTGTPLRLSRFKGKAHLVLVFNRGFT